MPENIRETHVMMNSVMEEEVSETAHSLSDSQIVEQGLNYLIKKF